MKKRLLLTTVFISFVCLLGFGQNYTVPTTGTSSITTCSGTIRDSGGTGNYLNSSNGYTIINPATPGNYVQLSGTLSIRDNDYFYIYDGAGITGTLLATNNGNAGNFNVPLITSSTGSLTVRFTSNVNQVDAGFELSIGCTPNPVVPASGSNSYTGCSGILYDNGGNGGNYLNNSNGYTIINPSTTGNYAQVSGSITTEGGWDYLTIYDGTGTGGTVLWGGSPHGTGTACTTFTVPIVTSISGSLTVRFHSDGSNNCSGFALNISCSTTPGSVAYCTPTSEYPSELYINNVAFLGTLLDPPSNTSTFTGGYQDFTGLSPIAIQAQGEGVNLTASCSGTLLARGGWKAWVDWNQDGDFADAGEEVYNTYTIRGAAVSFGFQIPASQTPGDYRIRIRVNNHYQDTGAYDYTSCDNFTGLWDGEAEDYLFTVIANCSSNITSISDGENCGSGSVILQADATAGVTEFRWYTTETGGVPIATSAPTGTSTSWTTPILTTTTTYYVTAYNGSCESLVRTPIIAKISPIPTVSFTPAAPIVCGDDILQLTAGGDLELIHLIDEDFESGNLGLFSNINNDANGAITDNLTRFQNRQSVYVPNSTEVNVWYPAVSSGFGANNFALSVSDATIPNQPTNPVNNALTLINPVDATDFVNLTLKLKLFYSRYYDNNTNPASAYARIELSTDGGLTYPNQIANFVSDIGYGTKFQTLTYNLSAYINQPNLKIRIRLYSTASAAGWLSDGVAVDDIELYGEKPLNTAFNYDTSTVDAFTDATAMTSYVPGTPATTIYIRPTMAQLENATFNIPVSAVLSNGCSATGNVTVTNNTKIWRGDIAGSSNWDDANNWRPNGVPNSDNCVIIHSTECVLPNTNTTPFPPVLYDGYAKNLTIKDTGNLNIRSENYLTVSEEINIEDNINPATVELNISNNASLIQISDTAVNTGTAEMKRDAVDVLDTDYVYWSTPVSGFNVNQIPAVPNNYIWKWTPTVSTNTNGFGDWTSAYNEAMVTGKGYAVRSGSNNNDNTASTNTSTFRGVLNNGIVTVPISRGTYNGADYTGPTATPVTRNDDNWNLIGNPYPSGLDADSFINLNTNIEGAVHIWTHGTQIDAGTADPFYEDFGLNYSVNDYITYNLTGTNTYPNEIFNGEIAAGQGFFVLMLHTSASQNETVTFNNSMRLRENSTFYKNSNNISQNTIEKHRIWLNLIAPSNEVSSTLVGYVEGATLQKDRVFDAYGSEDNALNIYSLIENERMVIQGRALPFYEEDQVPLGTMIPNTGIYTISISGVDGLFENDSQNIFLEDTQLGIIHNLRNSPYTFTVNSGMHNSRFILRYTDNALSIDDYSNNENITISAPNNEYVKVSSRTNTIKSVEVYDLLGRLLVNKTEINATEIVLKEISQADGTYIVKAELSNGKSKTQKVILKY